MYVLFEHQSGVDAMMPLRLLKYVVRVLERQVREDGPVLPLPLVVPVVLHHSEGAGRRRGAWKSCSTRCCWPTRR